MSKSLSKKIALCLAAIMLLSLLGACGGKEAPATSPAASEPAAAAPSDAAAPAAGGAPEIPAMTKKDSYNIGFQVWGAGVPILDSFGDAVDWTLRTLGSTGVRASDDFTADKELSNAQNFLASGVDGIMIQLSAGPVLLQIAKEAAERKTPLATYITIGDDPDIAQLADTNPYWVGACDSDLVLDGKLVGGYALADGHKNAVIIGGNIGDNSQDQRAQGFTEAFEAGGGKVLAVARCTDNSEAPQKAEDMLAANPEADCLYAMVGDYTEGSMLALENLNRIDSVAVYMSCVDAASAEYIKQGRIVSGNDGISSGAYIATTMLINFLDGHPIKDENGKSPRYSAHPFKVDKSNADAYLSVFYSSDQNIKPYPKTVLDNLLWRNNPDVSHQTYLDLINTFDLEHMIEANGLK